MPTKRYSLDSGGPERLEVSWKGSFKDLTLSLDGRIVGSVASQKELKAGREFRLEDGSTLRVQLAQPMLLPELQVSLNGQAVPGSAADPEQRLAAACGIIFFVAGFNVLLGLVAGLLQIQFLQSIGLGLGSIVSGAIYGVLGVFVKRRSTVALAIAVALFVLDGALSLSAVAKAGGTPAFGQIVVRVFLTLGMLQGLPGLKALKEAEEAARKHLPLAPAAARAGSSRPPAGPGSAAPGPAATGLATTPLAATEAGAVRTPLVKVFTGEAERRRLELSEKAKAPAAPVVARSALKPPAAGTGPVRGWGRDAAAEALRFLAHKCEVGEAGLTVTFTNLKTREVVWADIAGLLARQLPADPPWDARILLDIVAVASPGAAAEPIRLLSTTFVNYGALPGGASTSRMENMRRLGGHIASRNPAVAIDPETAAFLQGDKAPARFVNMTQFAEYDARYG